MRSPLTALLALVALLFSLNGWAGTRAPEPLRVGVTPVFLDDQLSLLRQWGQYLDQRLGRKVEFVQRGSYREIVNLTLAGKVDFAWICGYPFVRNAERLRLLAVPVYQGKPEYRAYLIVPADDRTTLGLDQLQGKVFAFSDPDSNSGYLFPQYRLHRAGKSADSHFRRTFYTGGHRKVVEAVAAGVADGGSVDGYIWDTLARLEPELTERTRIVERSEPFGFPPLVAGPHVRVADFAQMQGVLLRMSVDVEGQELLTRMNLDGFMPGDQRLYRDIERMSRTVGAAR
jgi:phosphonate transport system substrate-binding protein